MTTPVTRKSTFRHLSLSLCLSLTHTQNIASFFLGYTVQFVPVIVTILISVHVRRISAPR